MENTIYKYRDMIKNELLISQGDIFSNLPYLAYDHLIRSSPDILDKFQNEEQKDIISFSYFWYPKTAIKSKIKDNIFERKSIFSNLDGELEKEYNSIISSGYSIKDVIRESWRC